MEAVSEVFCIIRLQDQQKVCSRSRTTSWWRRRWETAEFCVPRVLCLQIIDNNGTLRLLLIDRCSFVALAGECQWLHLELIKEMRNFCKTLFPVVDYAYGTIPTYPSGQIGFMLCSKNPVCVWMCHCAFVVSSSNSLQFWGGLVTVTHFKWLCFVSLWN